MFSIDPDDNSFRTRLGRRFLMVLQHWNPNKYFKRREYVITPQKGFLWIKFIYLIWIKRIDLKHKCSFGTNINHGASFATPPSLPHGPNGIIVGHSVSIGRNARIYQHVTIAAGATIGDNAVIGAGAVVLEGRKVGNNVKIGANCVVVEDIPDNCTVVLPKPRIISH